MLQIIITILSAIFIATISSWITIQLSLKRFRSERWWEKKAEAYSKIIEAMHDFKAFSEKHLEAMIGGHEISDERDVELRHRAKTARREIDKIIDTGQFLLSEKSNIRLKKFISEIHSFENKSDWFEYLQYDLSISNKCLMDLIQLAKEDLKTE